MHPEISIIFPCRNEEAALPLCLAKAQRVIHAHNLDAEIIVSDSSSDKSPQIARDFGVRVIKHNTEGYGNAYFAGLAAARGTYLVMVDSDCTYDLEDIPRFVNVLKDGYDMVIGNRFGHKPMQEGAMPFLNRFVGNPFLSSVLRLFFHTNIHDPHCGLRAITREAFDTLNMTTTGMEFASEMIIKAVRRNLRIAQVSTSYFRRVGTSKLARARDGWRHVRFMLLYSPAFLFLYPGMMLFLLGIVGITLLTFTSVDILGVPLYVHPLFLLASLVVIGYQAIFFGIFAQAYQVTHLGEPEPPLLTRLYRLVNLEIGLVCGALLLIVGIFLFLTIFVYWIETSFGALSALHTALIASMCIILGVQTFFNAFMLSILGIRQR